MVLLQHNHLVQLAVMQRTNDVVDCISRGLVPLVASLWMVVAVGMCIINVGILKMRTLLMNTCVPKFVTRQDVIIIMPLLLRVARAKACRNFMTRVRALRTIEHALFQSNKVPLASLQLPFGQICWLPPSFREIQHEEWTGSQLCGSTDDREVPKTISEGASLVFPLLVQCYRSCPFSTKEGIATIII